MAEGGGGDGGPPGRSRPAGRRSRRGELPDYDESPRSYWTPTLARIYGLLPWHMIDVSSSEYEAIRRDVVELTKETSG